VALAGGAERALRAAVSHGRWMRLAP
jgi:hypothetical protein